ncbi:hypothetical protein, partial [Pseudomonas syringae]|uniref:hypothetical protein n=1 Tax=Pseudomonas syringae TaxID=317 RepID=UPI001F1DB8B7
FFLTLRFDRHEYLDIWFRKCADRVSRQVFSDRSMESAQRSWELGAGSYKLQATSKSSSAFS